MPFDEGGERVDRNVARGEGVPFVNSTVLKLTRDSNDRTRKLTMVWVLLLLPSAFLALGWLLELSPHDTILSMRARGEGWYELTHKG